MRVRVDHKHQRFAIGNREFLNGYPSKHGNGSNGNRCSLRNVVAGESVSLFNSLVPSYTNGPPSIKLFSSRCTGRGTHTKPSN